MNVSVAARALRGGKRGAKAELWGPTIWITSPVLAGEPGRPELVRAGKAGCTIFRYSGTRANVPNLLIIFLFHVLPSYFEHIGTMLNPVKSSLT
jgi:hypothetical protein